jgi:hypothetical protein
MDWRVFYISGKLLKRRCLKCACMTHLDIWNISYGQKKGWESNWQFDSQPLKVENRPNFLECRWHAKLWAPKVAGVLVVGISGLSLRSPETKCHLDVGLVERHKIYYKGEGGGFPQVWAVVSLLSLSCPWLVLAPKVLWLCTNHFVLVLCRSVWVVDACHSS